MFASLFRRSSSRPPARFALRVEALDGRVLPGGLAGGVLPSGGLTVASQVDQAHGQIGQEVAQAANGGQVDTFASRPTTGGDF